METITSIDQKTYASMLIQSLSKKRTDGKKWHSTDLISVAVPRSNGEVEEGWEVIAMDDQNYLVWQPETSKGGFKAFKRLTYDKLKEVNPKVVLPALESPYEAEPVVDLVRVSAKERAGRALHIPGKEVGSPDYPNEKRA